MNMNTILRTFFYSFGIAMLVCAWMLNPATAEFKDILRIFHDGEFWNLVGLIAILLLGAEMIFSGKIISAPAPTKSAAGLGRSQ
jgi:hypothetical protein